MSSNNFKRKADGVQRPRKRRQLTLAPRVIVEPILSDASTLIYENPADVSHVQVDVDDMEDISADYTMEDMDEAGAIVSDSDSLSSLSDAEGVYDENAPMRHDRPIVRGRWHPDEVDALMTGLNVNRDAIKFHFEGPGGGKDVKRQGWKDLTNYVNDTAGSHRTIRQCRTKASDYTQRVKAKYNRLRYEVSRTGRGRIKTKLKIKDVEAKALDYLRQEAVRGIPDIEPLSIGGPKEKKPSARNTALLWKPDRETKPNYDKVAMKRQGVPKNYNDKNKRRLARVQKEENRKATEKLMKAERKKERAEERKAKRTVREEKRVRKREREERRKRKDKKEKRAQEKEERRKLKEQKKEKKQLRRKRKEERQRRKGKLNINKGKKASK